MAPGDFVHTLDHTWLEAFPTGWGALEKRRQWDMVQAEWLPNRIHTYTRKITARAEVCSILAAHYGAMDSTTGSLCQLLHLSMTILQLQGVLWAEELSWYREGSCCLSVWTCSESIYADRPCGCPWHSSMQRCNSFHQPQRGKVGKRILLNYGWAASTSLSMRDPVVLVVLV